MAWWARGLLGLVLGGLFGLFAGFGVGLLAIDLFDVSCFEGYCGLLVVLTYAPAGLIIGALAGATLGLFMRSAKTKL